MTARCSAVLVSASLMLTGVRLFTTVDAAEPAPAAMLVVTSDPAGATVHLDGRFAGHTPLELTKLPAGDRRVRLTSDGYLENQRIVNISADRPSRLHVHMTARPKAIETPAAQTTSQTGGGGMKWLWIGLVGGGAAAAAVALSTRNHPPTLSGVTATPATGLMAGTAIAFAAAVNDDDGDSLTYTWDFNDGSSPSGGASPTHVYNTANTFTAKVTVSDGRREVSGTTPVTIKTLAGTWRGTLNGTPETFVFTQSAGTVGGTFSDAFGSGTLAGTVTTTAPRIRVTMTQPSFPAIVYTADSTTDVNTLNGVVNGGSFVGTPMTLTRQ
jgi:hypothetical protein